MSIHAETEEERKKRFTGIGVGEKLALKLDQCHGLVGTEDLTEWETGFISNLYERVFEKKYFLSEKQEDHLRKIWAKNFGDSQPVTPAPKPRTQAKLFDEYDDDIPL